jgi:heptosyltransferase III
VSLGKILVIRGGAIGDFVLTLPVLAALRRQFPEARLEVLGYSHIAQLALAGGLVDAVRSIESRALAGFFARRGELDAELREYFKSFAVILSYLYDPDEIFKDNVARCSKAQFIQGPHRPNESADAHASEVFLTPLVRLAIFDSDPVPKLSVGSPSQSRPGGRLRLALHPGSGSERKNWPEKHWAELLLEISRRPDLDLLVIGGEAEEGRVERLIGALPKERYELARNLRLSELAERMSHCAAFIGHDSGISHLAAAVGLPGIVLWGETNEAVWRPRSQGIAILRDDTGLEGISVARVLDELRRVLGACSGSG